MQVISSNDPAIVCKKKLADITEISGFRYFKIYFCIDFKQSFNL